MKAEHIRLLQFQLLLVLESKVLRFLVILLYILERKQFQEKCLD